MYYVLWRLDGPFNLTSVPSDYAPSESASSNEWFTAAVKAQNEHDRLAPNGGETDEEIAEQIARGTDPDHPEFIGYEMPVIFHGDNVKIIV